MTSPLPLTPADCLVESPTTTPNEVSVPMSEDSPQGVEERNRRTLILCFDGTSNRPVEAGTNVGRLFFALEKMDSASQKCYYQPGLGTYVPPTRPFGQITRTISQAADLAFAWFLQDHIMGGYRFLMNNYHDGDRVCIFGFSRGAYTARCLATMLSCVGLLFKDNDELVPFAYSLYRRSTGDGIYTAASFRKKVSRDICIEFMGLWDTVASVGMTSRVLPMALRLGVAKHFRQALALDECRAKFQPIPLYFASNERTSTSSYSPEHVYDPDPSFGTRLARRLRLGHSLPGIPPYGPSPNARKTLADASAKDMWFIGSHSDVGGNERSESDGLSTLSLLWMLRELEQANVPLKFRKDAFRLNPILRLQMENPQKLLKAQNYVESFSRGGGHTIDVDKSTREVASKLQAACEAPIQHKLAQIGVWHLLELLPLWHPYYNQYGERCQRLRINLGRGRRMIMKEPSYHWSVLVRMQLTHDKERYEPLAREVEDKAQPKGPGRSKLATDYEDWLKLSSNN